MQAIDILILSNGPGEVTTWVRPVVQALRQQLGDDRSMVRISVILSPCPNASGFEGAIARSYPQVDRVQEAQHFWQFLLSGKTAENWDWRTRGVILFLGGDQLFPVLISRHLGYRTVVYAEWETRWHQSIDRFGVMKADLIDRVPAKYTNKLTVVGDLMAEVASHSSLADEEQRTELIGLLPGSKAAKLAQGVPLVLAIAEYIHKHRPQTKFVIPVAPTLDIETLADFANPEKNPVIQLVKGSTAELILEPTPSLQQATSFSLPLRGSKLHPSKEVPMLKTPSGLCVELWTRSPAYDLLSQCCLCLTTVGANTAELGALAVPMIVLLPTQQLDAMRAWDGIPGLLANLPLVGTSMAKVINWLALRRLGLLAWPNIWAKSEVVPELVGKLQPENVAEFALDFLQHPEKLEQMRSHLRSIRGEPGAAQKLATLVCEELERSHL